MAKNKKPPESLNTKITALGKRVKELELERDNWFRVFDSLPDMVFLMGEDYTITNANKAFLKAFNVKHEDVVGEKCYEVLYKTNRPWPVCPMGKTVADLKHHTVEVNDPKTGASFLMTTSPILNNKKEVHGVVHVVRDISMLKKAEEIRRKKMEEAVAIKSEFTSTISHELRTPLAAIKEGIEIVFDGTSGELNEKQKEFLGIAKRNIDRLARIVNDILDFQKLETGKMVFNMEAGSINEVAKEAAQSMAMLAYDKDIEFVADLDDNLPQVKFDKSGILQVLTNLISNAIAFTEKGSVLITTEKEGNCLKVSVRDTGVGIKKEDIPKLFQQFTQIDTGVDRKIGSTGLGLVISKSIIEKHKGKIWAESEFSKGSTFSFLLPIDEQRR